MSTKNEINFLLHHIQDTYKTPIHMYVGADKRHIYFLNDDEEVVYEFTLTYHKEF